MKSLLGDYELTELIQRDDMVAFSLLYEKYSNRLYFFGFKYLGSKEDAEDLVQSVFQKFWEKRRVLRKKASVKSFLFTIAYNDLCKFYRKRKYFREFIKETLNQSSEPSYEIYSGIEAGSTLERISNLIRFLPEKKRLVFQKNKLEGKTSKEIAKEMNLKPQTIDNYISDALKFIKNTICISDLVVILFLFI